MEWPASWTDVSIAPKELAPIVFAALVFGRDLQNHHVLFQSDNSTVVAALQQGTCRDPRVMQLLCMLHFVAAHYSFTFTSAHLPGRCNTLADAISRNQANSSALMSSQLSQISHPVSSTIIDLVCDLEVDWTSDDWNSRLRACLEQVQLRRRTGRIVRVMHGIGGSALELTCCLFQRQNGYCACSSRP